eukprot:124434-Amphidinium_carterae.3
MCGRGESWTHVGKGRNEASRRVGRAGHWQAKCKKQEHQLPRGPPGSGVREPAVIPQDMPQDV